MFLLSYNDIASCEPNKNELNIIPEKSNFRFAFYILPKEKRNAIINIYTLCSYLDNIVDDSSNNLNEIKIKKERLEWWKYKIHKIYTNNIVSDNSKFTLEFKKIIKKFNIPEDYFNILIDGIAKDLIIKQYINFEQLLDYCYGVASIVGLICTCIFDDTTKISKNYAINLGYALQLTNIIRDIYLDSERNYIYIPQDDLIKCNFSKEDIINKNYNENFVKLAKIQYSRAIFYYNKAENCLKEMTKEVQKKFKSAEIMKNIYFELLNKIQDKQFNIFGKKIKLSTPEKLFITLKTIL